MSACRFAVGHQRPFKAGKRPVVGNVDKTAKRHHPPDHIVSRRGDLIEIVTKNLDSDRKRPAGAFLLLGDAEIGAGKAGDKVTHPVDQGCRLVTLVPVGKNGSDGADGIAWHLIATTTGTERAGIEILHAVNRQDCGLGAVDQRVALLGRQITTRKHLDLRLIGFDIGEEGHAEPGIDIADKAGDDDAKHHPHGQHGKVDCPFQKPAIASRRRRRNGVARH